MREDIYTRITNSILVQLEQGTRPWFKPWNAEHAAGRITRPLRANGIPYRGINVLSLWMEAEAKGYAAPIWITYKQAFELGAHVRKGERGSLVVFASKTSRTETDTATGAQAEREIAYLKGYTVFNVEQVEGLPAHFYQSDQQPVGPIQRITHAENFFAAIKADIRHGGNRAYYNITEDFVQMPPFESFRDPESYYETLAHECTHWTRHKTRLDRDLGRKRGACPRLRAGGDEGYAMEELVAELGAAFLSSDLGLSQEVRADHAGYIASWIKVLKDDKRAIFTAASHAQRAADFLNGLQPQAHAEAA